MRQSLVMYTRPECELCDKAAALIAEAGAEVIYRDIRTDLGWLRRYRDRIPVVARPEGGPELGWPFELEDLERLLGGES